MINTACLPRAGKYPPFLPYNFYEAPQYAAYRPPTAITLTEPPTPGITKSAASPGEAAPIKPRTKKTRPATRQAEWERQARAREIHGWLDNLHLLHENYIATNSDRRGITQPRCSSGANTEQAIAVKATESVAKKARGAPKKVALNRLKPYLKHFIFPREALAGLPMFDDIVTGAVKDSGGNTRPLSKTMMVSLLQGLDQITAEAIQEDKGLSLRHSQRIAMCLRIIERTAFKVAQAHWYAPSEVDWSDLD
ncbi:hypothetical protein ACI48D_12940 [Massilia sp. LXY-6]|uniref:hypothetical protein n=1 Tax=Massilia sp. LXY-6 TaxID=3379823 RepID=UPI003EDF3960